MATPSIQSRLRRRFLLVTADRATTEALRAALPPDWEMTPTTDLAFVGDFAEILQQRFLLLDLDETSAFDPLEVLRELRVNLMLNVPVFCFGGTPGLRDEARLARADRFFERGEIAAKLPEFCTQYGWGG